MSTVQEPPTATPVGTPSTPPARDLTNYVDHLRENTTGIRLRSTKLGTTRKMTEQQRNRVAELFQANPDYVHGGKRLLNTRHKAWRAVMLPISQAKAIWIAHTYPYPESLSDSTETRGMRIISRDKIDELELLLTSKQSELAEAVKELQDDYWEEICDQSRVALAQLHINADYPTSLEGLFQIEWSYSSIDPPDWMQQAHPDLYRRESERVRHRLEDAITAHENMMASQLNSLVQVMIEKMQPGEDGEIRRFTKPNLANFQEFFGTFRDMNIGSNSDLEDMVLRAEEALEGVTKEELNESSKVRSSFQQSMEDLAGRLDPMMTTAPTRRIVLHEEDEPESSADTEEPV